MFIHNPHKTLLTSRFRPVKVTAGAWGSWASVAVFSTPSGSATWAVTSNRVHQRIGYCREPVDTWPPVCPRHPTKFTVHTPDKGWPCLSKSLKKDISGPPWLPTTTKKYKDQWSSPGFLWPSLQIPAKKNIHVQTPSLTSQFSSQIQPKLQRELEVHEVQNQSSPPVIQEPHHQQMSEQNKYVIFVTNCNIL